MLSDEVLHCLTLIYYVGPMNATTIDPALDRILGRYIFEPLARVSPLENARMIREALASDEKLSEIGLGGLAPEWTEESIRELLTQLVARIEFYLSSGGPKNPDVSRLTESLDKLRPLVQPLAETSNLSDAIKRFEENLLPTFDYSTSGNSRDLIRRVLRFDTSKILPALFTPEAASHITDDTFREYLRNIGRKIRQ